MNTHKDLDDQFDENKKYIHQLDDNRYPILFTNKIFAKKMSPHIKETIFYAPNKYSQNSLQKNFEKSYGEGNFVYEHVKPIEYLSRYRQNNEMLIKYLPSKGKHWFSKCNIEKFKKQIMGITTLLTISHFVLERIHSLLSKFFIFRKIWSYRLCVNQGSDR